MARIWHGQLRISSPSQPSDRSEPSPTVSSDSSRSPPRPNRISAKDNEKAFVAEIMIFRPLVPTSWHIVSAGQVSEQ